MNRIALFGIILMVALHEFDEFVLIIALPTIVKSFDGQQWYGQLYLLHFASLQVSWLSHFYSYVKRRVWPK